MELILMPYKVKTIHQNFIQQKSSLNVSANDSAIPKKKSIKDICLESNLNRSYFKLVYYKIALI